MGDHIGKRKEEQKEEQKFNSDTVDTVRDMCFFSEYIYVTLAAHKFPELNERVLS